jgi:inner membrane protein
MITLTHLAFAAIFAGDVKANLLQVGVTVIGSTLPDLDHPQSFIGKILSPVSSRLNLRYGHRKEIHGLPLWFTILLIGKFLNLELIQWLVIGAISHAIIDCYNTSGVALLAPFSDKRFVFFSKDSWQIPSGSRQDYFCCIAFVLCFGLTQYVYFLGGARAALNLVMQSPKVTVEHYIAAGTQRCEISGKFRWSDGRTEKVQWLIVGSEGDNLVYFDGKKLIRENQHGKFLRSSLMKLQQDWISVKINGVGITSKASFFFDGKRWYYTPGGSKVMGIIRSVDNSMPEIQIDSNILPAATQEQI